MAWRTEPADLARNRQVEVVDLPRLPTYRHPPAPLVHVAGALHDYEVEVVSTASSQPIGARRAAVTIISYELATRLAETLQAILCDLV